MPSMFMKNPTSLLEHMIVKKRLSEMQSGVPNGGLHNGTNGVDGRTKLASVKNSHQSKGRGTKVQPRDRRAKLPPKISLDLKTRIRAKERPKRAMRQVKRGERECNILDVKKQLKF